ncbi:MAG TPA: hypothetical protein VNQ79_04845 [Blastocatellia bacterium]|nr:hypothetical protein [Blastocatellia bacterium]
MTVTGTDRKRLIQLLDALSLARFERLIDQEDELTADEFIASEPSGAEPATGESAATAAEAVIASAEESAQTSGPRTAARQTTGAAAEPTRWKWSALLEVLAGRAGFANRQPAWQAVTTAEGCGDYFTADGWLRRHAQRGLLTERGGTRMLVVTQGLMLGVLEGLNEEYGQQAAEVIRRCGDYQGRRLMARLTAQLAEFSGTPLSELAAGEVLTTLEEAWAALGWGCISFASEPLARGFIRVRVSGAPLPAAAAEHRSQNEATDSLSAGILAGMFSHAAEADLAAHQIAGDSSGESCEFIIGLKNRLAAVPGLVRSGMKSDEIISRLANA